MIGITPAIVLAVLVAAFHTGIYVILRNRFERHVVVAWLAAVAAALAANALGARVGGDPVRLGDFSVLWASAGAWAAIIFVSLVALLGPTPRR